MLASSDFDTEVLIVGGGLVGQSLALALATGGIDCVMIDRAPPQIQTTAEFDGRVSAIALASSRILDGLGAWSAAADAAQPILDIRVSDGDAPLFLHYDHRSVGDAPMGYIVENRVLRHALNTAAAARASITHIAPAALAAYDSGPYGIDATFDDGRRCRARLMVGCDGRNSRVATLAGIDRIVTSYHQIAIVCTVAHERPHRGIAHERFLPAGPFAILPMTGDRSSLVWTEAEDLAPALVALDETAFLDELAARFGDFLGALKVVGPRWTYPLSLSRATGLTAPRVALAGDAAHGIHPIAGQGFNLGLRDIAALAEVLVDARRLGLDIGDAHALRRYARWRRFETLTMIAVTDGLNHLFSNDIAPVKLARDLGLAAVDRLPPLKNLFMRHAMGTVGDLPRLARGESI